MVGRCFKKTLTLAVNYFACFQGATAAHIEICNDGTTQKTRERMATLRGTNEPNHNDERDSVDAVLENP